MSLKTAPDSNPATQMGLPVSYSAREEIMSILYLLYVLNFCVINRSPLLTFVRLFNELIIPSIKATSEIAN